MKFREPTRAEAARLALVLGILAYAMAVAQLVRPRVPDGAGRWGWLWRSLYDNFGFYGLAGWWGLIGTIFLAVYFSTRR